MNRGLAWLPIVLFSPIDPLLLVSAAFAVEPGSEPKIWQQQAEAMPSVIAGTQPKPEQRQSFHLRADFKIVVTDPEDATKFAEIKRADIEEIIPASESLMPRGLLDQLNEREVLDLVAYTLSKGDKNDPRFRRP